MVMAKTERPPSPETQALRAAVKRARDAEQTAIHALGVASGKRGQAEDELARAVEAAAERARAEPDEG